MIRNIVQMMRLAQGTGAHGEVKNFTDMVYPSGLLLVKEDPNPLLEREHPVYGVSSPCTVEFYSLESLREMSVADFAFKGGREKVRELLGICQEVVTKLEEVALEQDRRLREAERKLRSKPAPLD